MRESGLIFEAGSAVQTSYSFNHSLVQEAAYESLPRSRRQSLHKQIADDLESGSAATGESEPTVVAHHYSRAGEAEKSFHFWMLAADRSGQRLAFAESVANLTSAIAEAERVADMELRTRLKLDAQLRLGATLVLHKGPQTSEAGSALEQAKALAQEINAGPQLFQATWGLFLNAARNRRYDKAGVLSEELATISRDLGDEDLKFEALHHRWGFVYFMGQTAKILECTAEGLERYDRDRHHRFSYVFAGHDPGVCAHCVRAVGLGVAGHAGSVRPTLDAGLALANSLQHPLTLAFFQSVGCFAMHIVRDADGCSEFSEQLIQVSEKYDFPATRAVGTFMLGASRALQGDIASALAQMEPAFEAALAYGFLGMLPGTIMADALAGAGRDREALALITRLLDGSSTPRNRHFHFRALADSAENSCCDRSVDNALQAENFLGMALRIATDQGAPVFQLRAGTALARLLTETGRRDEAKIVINRASTKSLAGWDGPEITDAAQFRTQLN